MSTIPNIKLDICATNPTAMEAFPSLKNEQVCILLVCVCMYVYISLHS